MRTGIDINKVKEILIDTPFKKYEVENITEGVSTDVFKLIYKDTYYLKILPQEDSLLAITLANNLLLDLGVRVAKIEYTSENNSTIDNRSFYIEKEIKGKSIKGDHTLSKQQEEQILFEAGKDLAKINSIKVLGVGWIEGVKDNKLYSHGKTYDDFILRNMDSMLNQLSENNILSSNQKKKIKDYIINNQNIINTNNTSFLAHGDFSINHIYSKNGKYSGIIDFGDIRGTSKYHDLGHFYTFSNSYFNSLEKGYSSEYKLSNNYMEIVEVEAVIFAVSKLWWISENRLQKTDNHPTLKLFEKIVY